MQIVKLMLKRDTFLPVAALVFASAICVALVVARIGWTGKLRYGFLVWNLFLAWLPLMFAILAEDCFQKGKRPGWQLVAMSAAWLLFFPNAPYIFTDLVHLTNRFFAHFWVDLAIVLSCAFTGLILGFVSLYLMHSIVTRMLGRMAGWTFVAVAAGLCSFGIYLGRFLRFNSWDVIAKPGKLASSISSVATGDTAQPQHLAFLVLFATFLFIAYVMLYALTHLPTLIQTRPASTSATSPAVA
jgi:uncharacterized membrane protein